MGHMSQTVAQGLLNASFEDWSPSGQAPPFNWEFPSDWTTNNATTEFITAVVNKAGQAPDGNFVAHLENTSVFGEVVPAIMVNGTTGVNYQEYTPTLHDAGTPFTGHAVSLSGLYSYAAASAVDSAVVEVWTKKWNTTTLVADTVDYGLIKLGPQGSFSSFQLMLENRMANTSPDSIVVRIASSDIRDSSSVSLGTELEIDKLSLDTVPLGIDPFSQRDEFRMYPNPAQDIVYLESRSSENGIIRVMDLAGREVLPQTLQPAGETSVLQIQDLPPGFYLVQWFGFKGGDKTARSLVIY